MAKFIHEYFVESFFKGGSLGGVQASAGGSRFDDIGRINRSAVYGVGGRAKHGALFEMRPAAAAVWCVCCAGWWLLDEWSIFQHYKRMTGSQIL